MVADEVREVVQTKSRIWGFVLSAGETLEGSLCKGVVSPHLGFTKIALDFVWKIENRAARLEARRPVGRPWEYWAL